MDMPASDIWTPTRDAGLGRLAAFAPAMGSRYASRRNYDLGPGHHDGVSCLSPFVRRRLLTERELVETALAHHTASAAEKFVQEVFWRSYFRGWLENRPGVWGAYLRGLERDLMEASENRGLAKRLAAAEEGRTGLDCFDAWVEELVDTGYLHNHARMWFASIWIFTLGLPWRLGADFFLRHLLDGCPASNTLGWRWVGGLHTRGKTYQAQAWNIAKFTKGRFTPEARDLAPEADALNDPDEVPPVCPPRVPASEDQSRQSVLLITMEDCRPEELGLVRSDLAGVGLAAASAWRSPREVSPAVAAFDAAALQDAGARAAAKGAAEAQAIDTHSRGALAAWAQRQGARQILTPYVPAGPVKDWLDREAASLAEAGIAVAEVRRDWDSAVWPHATAGYFKVKSKIPRILGELALTG